MERESQWYTGIYVSDIKKKKNKTEVIEKQRNKKDIQHTENK